MKNIIAIFCICDNAYIEIIGLSLNDKLTYFTEVAISLVRKEHESVSLFEDFLGEGIQTFQTILKKQ